MEECCVEVHLHVGGHLKEIGFRKKTFLIHSKFMLGVNHHFPGNILLCNKLAEYCMLACRFDSIEEKTYFRLYLKFLSQENH